MADIAVSVEGLGKRYRIGHQRDPYGRLTESLWGAMRAPFDRLRGNVGPTSEWIWALKDVSFELRQGDIVGVIGRNGAGKTTLLKLLSRITEPTTGRAMLHGRAASLLEVGTGFHPELTGRENVLMSGAVLGMHRGEIAQKFDEIVEFAGVEQFLDTPVKRYSSGMQVRLGFAVAAHLEPEILFVDEVLAVGDLAFQKKCLGKMSAVAGEGRTVVFVSHNMGAVGTLCPMTLWLDRGGVRMAGKTGDVVPEYVRASATDHDPGSVTLESDESLEAQVTRVRILSATGELMPIGECSNPLTIEMLLDVRQCLPGLYAYLEVQRSDGTTVLMSDSFDTDPNPLDDLRPGRHVVSATIPARTLASGEYDVYLNLSSINAGQFNVHSPGVVASFRLHDSQSRRGDARPGFFSTLLRWQVEGPSHADGLGLLPESSVRRERR
jgi:lipopolysaccharide transport system ATP-binding protein